MRFSLRTLMGLTAWVALAAWTYRLSPEVACAAGGLVLVVNLGNARDEYPEFPPANTRAVTSVCLIVAGGIFMLLGATLLGVDDQDHNELKAGVVCLLMACLTSRLGRSTQKHR